MFSPPNWYLKIQCDRDYSLVPGSKHPLTLDSYWLLTCTTMPMCLHVYTLMPERLRWSLLSTLWKYHNFKVTICVCCRIGMLCTDLWGCPWESKFLMLLWCLSLPIRQRWTWLLKYFQHCFHILPLSQNRIHSRFPRSHLFLTSINYI